MANNLYICYESAVGFGLFRVLEAESVNIKTLQDSIKNLSTFRTMIKLEAFRPFASQVQALESINKISEGLAPPALIEFLLESLPTKSSNLKLKSSDNSNTRSNLRKITLGFADPNLGSSVKDILLESFKKTGNESNLLIDCQCNDITHELIRGIRSYFDQFVNQSYNFEKGDAEKAQIGLGHSYSRMKIKFNVNRADNMIIQAICLLDQIDKDLNTYCMRAKEWYGWHFPELTKIISDQVLYVRLMYYIGDKNRLARLGTKEAEKDKEKITQHTKKSSSKLRKDNDNSNASSSNVTGGGDDDDPHAPQLCKDEDTYIRELEDITEDPHLAIKIIELAKSSMGVEVSQIDIISMRVFAKRIIKLAEFRKKLYNYLSDRMENCAPNLSALMGEQIGARLISKAGSLLKLAKYPASTIQILGAEKALFRALKSKGKCNTPKYGLIYNTSYITKANAKNKGRISRYLANKAAMATRLDCFLDNPTDKYGTAFRKQVEERLTFFKSGTQPTTNAKVMSQVREELLTEATAMKGRKQKHKQQQEEDDDEDSDSDEEEDDDVKDIELVTRKGKDTTKTKTKTKPKSKGIKRKDDSEDIVEEPPKKKQKLMSTTPTASEKKKSKKNMTEEEKQAYKAAKKAEKKRLKKQKKQEEKAKKKAAKKLAKKLKKKQEKEAKKAAQAST